MTPVNLKVQVICLSPSWINYEKNRYRIYIDDELLAERDWVWSKETIIDEDLWIKAEPASRHIIKLIPVLQSDSVAKFALRKLRIQDVLRSDVQGNDSQITFTV